MVAAAAAPSWPVAPPIGIIHPASAFAVEQARRRADSREWGSNLFIAPILLPRGCRQSRFQ
jgi:hypothetical protein